ncbi:MAG TPA: vanadium-dependent haloperoxidase, partial [Polyangiaceae bacterium]
LVNRAPPSAPLLQGVSIGPDGTTWVTGLGGSIYRSDGQDFKAVDPGIDFHATQSLHSAWVDPTNAIWTVGGNVLSPPLTSGLALHFGPSLSQLRIDPATPPPPTCPADAIDPAPDGSIARRWDEQLLNAIRRDVPRPTVHARNLFHTAVAMWDAWAAYDPVATGYFTHERRTSVDPDGERQEAISYAAYRVLSHRYATAVGGGVSQACFDAFMAKLGYDPADSSGTDARAFGNRVGAAVVDAFADDGANEANDYAPPAPFTSDVPNLIVDNPGTRTTDPLHWQKLVIAQAATQNGIPLGSAVQEYVCPHWGSVTPFSLVRPAQDEPYLDIGHPPVLLDQALVDAVVEVLRKSAELDFEDGVTMDISPASYGNNSLGANDGAGRPMNPVTGQPYAPQVVKRGDFTRVLAEFWADGPKSETPPGHWNTIANAVADRPDFARRLFGSGDPLDPLSWDVHAYLALNGALHDAAIAAWELKRVYTAARPISLIRYMGELGQRSDPALPSYDPNGLPLVDNLIELITADSSAAGQRHAQLARYVGQIAVRSWRGEPGDRANEVGGIGWIRAIDWMPYQRRTFVTPAFPGYMSGHSTFSRAAATVLAGITGSELFPGGLGSFSCPPGYLVFEHGPSQDVVLQWATYYDASDQAGQSRLWGGIHIRHDDFDGRRVGSLIGSSALERARMYFEGSATP